MGRYFFEEVGEVGGVVIYVRRHEDREAGGEDFQIDGELRPLVSVHIGPQRFFIVDGDVCFLDTHHGNEVGTHLEAGQKFRRLADGIEPGEVVEEAQLDDALISFFRGNEISEAPCRVSEHGGDQRGGDLDHGAVLFFDLEVVGFLLI